MTSQPLFQNTYSLRRPGVAILAGIIRIVFVFIETISRKVKKIEIIYQNAIYIRIS